MQVVYRARVFIGRQAEILQSNDAPVGEDDRRTAAHRQAFNSIRQHAADPDCIAIEVALRTELQGELLGPIDAALAGSAFRRWSEPHGLDRGLGDDYVVAIYLRAADTLLELPGGDARFRRISAALWEAQLFFDWQAEGGVNRLRVPVLLHERTMLALRATHRLDAEALRDCLQALDASPERITRVLLRDPEYPRLRVAIVPGQGEGEDLKRLQDLMRTPFKPWAIEVLTDLGTLGWFEYELRPYVSVDGEYPDSGFSYEHLGWDHASSLDRFPGLQVHLFAVGGREAAAVHIVYGSPVKTALWERDLPFGFEYSNTVWAHVPGIYHQSALRLIAATPAPEHSYRRPLPEFPLGGAPPKLGPQVDTQEEFSWEGLRGQHVLVLFPHYSSESHGLGFRGVAHELERSAQAGRPHRLLLVAEEQDCLDLAVAELDGYSGPVQEHLTREVIPFGRWLGPYEFPSGFCVSAAGVTSAVIVGDCVYGSFLEQLRFAIDNPGPN